MPLKQDIRDKIEEIRESLVEVKPILDRDGSIVEGVKEKLAILTQAAIDKLNEMIVKLEDLLERLEAEPEEPEPKPVY